MAENETPEMNPEQLKAFEERMDTLMFKAKDAVADFLNNMEDVTTFDVMQFAILFNIYIGRALSEQEYRPERPFYVKDAMISVFTHAFSALDVLAETNEELGPNFVPERYKTEETETASEEDSE